MDLGDLARDAAAAITVIDDAIVLEPERHEELKRRALIVPPEDRREVSEQLLSVAARAQDEEPGLPVPAFDALIELAALVLGNGNRNADAFEAASKKKERAHVLGKDETSHPDRSPPPAVVDTPLLTPPRHRIRI